MDQNHSVSGSAAATKQLTYDRLGGAPGMIGVLHTNSRKLDFQPHIHYTVPAIVLNRDENTVQKITEKFFSSPTDPG